MPARLQIICLAYSKKNTNITPKYLSYISSNRITFVFQFNSVPDLFKTVRQPGNISFLSKRLFDGQKFLTNRQG